MASDVGGVRILREDLSSLGDELRELADLAATGEAVEQKSAAARLVQSTKSFSSLRRRIRKVEDSAVRESLGRQLAKLEAQAEATKSQISEELVHAVAEDGRGEAAEQGREISAEKSIAAQLEDIVGDFGTVSREVSSVRLTLFGEVIATVDDIVRALDGAMREFRQLDGADVHRSMQKVNQQNIQFSKRVNDWERRARKREEDAKREGLAKGERRKMEAEHHGVRNRIPLALKQFQRLLLSLEKLQLRLEGQAAAAADEAADETSAGPAQLPPGFLEVIEADSSQKIAVVEQHFEIEARLNVEREATADGVQKVLLVPFPPTNRFYYLVESDRIIRIRRAKIGRVISIEDAETGENEEMTMKDFVAHVPSGLWLLRQKPNVSE